MANFLSLFSTYVTTSYCIFSFSFSESVAENRNRPRLNRSYDSVSHSRESSIHEDVGEGYVSMAPLSVDAGYISMDHSGRKQGLHSVIHHVGKMSSIFTGELFKFVIRLELEGIKWKKENLIISRFCHIVNFYITSQFLDRVF